MELTSLLSQQTVKRYADASLLIVIHFQLADPCVKLEKTKNVTHILRLLKNIMLQ